MTEAIPPLTVDIIFNTSGINTGVAKATEGLNKITGSVHSVSSSMGRLKETMLGVFGGNLATQGVMVIEHALMEAKKEFFDAQAATERLGQAMDNMGVHSEETRKKIEQNVEAYSKLGFEGAESANAMGTLITATGDVEQSTKLMAMAADLARYKHVSMQDAAKILARGTQGAARAFKELGITLDTTIPKNQAISKAFDELNKKIGGQAVAYTKSFEGQMAIMKERMQEVFNTIAKYVIPALSFLFGMFNKLASYVEKNATPLKVLAGLLVVVTANLWATAAAEAVVAALNPFTLLIAGAAALAAGFVYLWNHWKTFRDSMAEGLATIIGLIGYLVGGIASLIRAMSHLPGMKALKGVADEADKAAKAIGRTAKAVDDLKNKKISASKIGDGMPTGFVKPGDATGIKGNVPGGNAAGTGGGGGTNVQYVTVYASDTNDIYKKLSKAAKNGAPIGGK